MWDIIQDGIDKAWLLWNNNKEVIIGLAGAAVLMTGYLVKLKSNLKKIRSREDATALTLLSQNQDAKDLLEEKQELLKIKKQQIKTYLNNQNGGAAAATKREYDKIKSEIADVKSKILDI